MAKVMRIIARLNVGGPAIHVVLLTKGLEPDFETLLVCGTEEKHEGSMRYFAVEKGVAPAVIPGLGREIHPLKDLIVLWRLYRLMKRERPDIVHTHTAKAGAVGRVAARLAGVPVVVHTYHGHVFHSYFSPLKTRLFLWIERQLARWTDRIVVLSPRQQEEIAQLGVCEPGRMTIIPLGLELSRLESQTHKDLRQEWGIPPGHKLVGIVGRLAPVKNHRMFLKVAQRLAHRPDVTFVVVGDGELRGELEDQARALGLTDRVRFVGWVQDMAAAYQVLDLVALTSRNEGTPLSLIEAMMVAKPVVATGVGGVSDIVRDGVTGFVVPLDDDAAMSSVLERLLDNPGLRAEIGGRAQTEARERFRAERLLTDVRRLYRDLLRAAGQPERKLRRGISKRN